MEGTSEAALNHAEGGARSAGQKGRNGMEGAERVAARVPYPELFWAGRNRTANRLPFISLTCKEKERKF